MKKTIRVTAKKVEDAINQGLEMLGVSIAEAEITVISSGGFLKKAEVEISIGVDDAPVAAPEAPKADQAVKATFIADEKKAAEQRTEQKPFERKPFEKRPEQKPEARREPENREPAAEQSREPRFNHNRKPFEKPAPRDRREDGRGHAPLEKKPREPRPSAPATEDAAHAAEAFLSKTLTLMGIEGAVKSDIADGLAITIDTADSAVIGHRGEMLDALQYLTSLVVNDGAGKYVQVCVDALGYRSRRADSLKRLADKMADKCAASGRRVALEPMNSSDRKEIHAYLSENGKVVTKSEGNEPNRKIVIYPAR